jgi:hypothetical protein
MGEMILNTDREKSDFFHKIHHFPGDYEESGENTVRAVGPCAEKRTCKLPGTGSYSKTYFTQMEKHI